MNIVSHAFVADIFHIVAVGFHKLISYGFIHEVVVFPVDHHGRDIFQILGFSQRTANGTPGFQGQPGGFVFCHCQEIFIDGRVVVIPPIHIFIVNG